MSDFGSGLGYQFAKRPNNYRRTHFGPICHRPLGGLTTEPKRQPAIPLFQGEYPRTHRLDSWWILLVMLIVIVIIGLFWWIIANTNETRVNKSDYLLVCGDNFQHGKLVYPDTSVKTNLSYQSKSAYFPVKPDVNRWTMQQLEGLSTRHKEPVFYTQQVDNARLTKSQLHIVLRRQKTIIQDSRGLRRYSLTSARLVSRTAFIYGFFVVRVRLDKGLGLRPYISLLPFLNVAMNEVGSKYGPWAAGGEINWVETKGLDPYWLGRVHFGGPAPWNQQSPSFPDDRLTKLDWSQWHIFGLKWTPKYISWHLGTDIDEKGHLRGGRCLLRITVQEWYSLVLAKEPYSEKAVGPRYLPPAPFDQPFHLVLGLAGRDIAREAEMVVDWVKVYQRPGFHRQQGIKFS